MICRCCPACARTPSAPVHGADCRFTVQVHDASIPGLDRLFDESAWRPPVRPSRSLAALIVVLIVAGVGLLAGLAALAWKVGRMPLQEPLTQTLRTSDGRSRLRAPASWSLPVAKELEQGQLLVLNRDRDTLVKVVSEAKDDLPGRYSLDFYSRFTAGLVKSRLQGGEILEGPASLLIDGRPALRHLVCGIERTTGVKVRLLHTIVESPTHFHIVAAVTPAKQFHRGRGQLEVIVASFRETN